VKNDPRKLVSGQVAAICGVTDRTVRNWCSKKQHKQPFKRIPNGHRYLWDAAKLLEWLTNEGKHQEALRVKGYIDSLERSDPVAEAVQTFAEAAAADPPPPRSPSAPSPHVSDNPEDMDIFQALGGAARLVQDTTTAYADAGPRDKLLIAKSLKELLETYLKVDREAFDRDQHLRPKIELPDACKVLGQALSTARTNLMSLCWSISQELAVMDDAAAISDYLQRQFTSALRTLEQRFLQAKIEEYLP
jgi:hypothetical protein